MVKNEQELREFVEFGVKRNQSTIKLNDNNFREILKSYYMLKDFVTTNLEKQCDFTDAACLMYAIIYNGFDSDYINTLKIGLDAGLKMIENPTSTVHNELLNDEGKLEQINIEEYIEKNSNSYDKHAKEFLNIMQNADENRIGDTDFDIMVNYVHCLTAITEIYSSIKENRNKINTGGKNA